MTFESHHTVGFARDEVWDWFASPGAVTRLTPPFAAMRVEREAGSLRDGETLLRPALPSPAPRLGFLPTWVARHDPAGFVEGERFVDDTVGSPYRQLWRRHVHGFADAPGGTDIVDRIDARLPRGMLAPITAFRASRVASDLAARARIRELPCGDRRLTVAVSGSSGLVGTQLTALLTTSGHRVIRLVRGRAEGADERTWEPDAPAADLLDGVDALVHLAGSSIAGRFTSAHKRRLRDSRIGPTGKLARLVAARGGATTMVCASAIGYYGADRGDEVLLEGSPPGDGFVASVVADWEDACAPAAQAGARVVTVRTGIVLSAAGGVLGMLSPLFRLGLGGRLGDGRQWFAWIGLDDLLDVYHRAIVDDALRGPVNAVAPQELRNAEYTRILGRVLGRPTVIPVPGFAPRLVLGAEGAEQLASANQRVHPGVLAGLGHEFRHPELAAALRHELGRER